MDIYNRRTILSKVPPPSYYVSDKHKPWLDALVSSWQTGLRYHFNVIWEYVDHGVVSAIGSTLVPLVFTIMSCSFETIRSPFWIALQWEESTCKVEQVRISTDFPRFRPTLADIVTDQRSISKESSSMFFFFLFCFFFSKIIENS